MFTLLTFVGSAPPPTKKNNSSVLHFMYPGHFRKINYMCVEKQFKKLQSVDAPYLLPMDQGL